ncbi:MULTISPECIES: ABC transporter ATP-binding protein [Thalassospira]|jgi:iron(III) transport system ATP-binding protein|uniref:Sugar ABC transporter substrate-binding protein n=1 Tax=Thalassospira xiamenensis TaxID=220697 RepID=A0ABR5Y5D7_9PROT|nr:MULTISPECIES: ABC transporter ATP-binding protein [Thalassospira]MAL30543.1 ABC transporter ATP-binding protein [Thalassospira sp.]MBR9781558.1 ABC transporter ATP-binding protein [Rhodospirillales bacterium]KZD06365.1 sugar ABC transporter substrate-binding protein [Thalassospira xiamenensis]KZD07837.1 sugar ABC transporter substrate-binding protein [Thalassospira xiamenensis]MBR9815051.1 ABC transporter ATP-binding protein [Rhodospirillales bacterium]|tara:strand:+ start:21470 stop:22570 length:1101 start_codon:yes stop_codon:yes gene_type:complete
MKLKTRAGSVVFDNVTKTYGHGAVTAIDNVSFTIHPGELVTLLGPSGCGKTTTLRMIAGLEHATTGKILIGGKDVTQLPATDRDVSMVFQSYALFPHMTVAENVAYGLSVTGVAKAEAREKAEEGLNLVGLGGYGSRLPSELSGGQQQRVAVARALVLEPEVLLLDEPLSNLDAKLRRHVRTEIRDLQQKLGLTAVYVTHDQEEALAVSDRIIVMNRAVIAQQGTPRELYEQPQSEFIADFIGDANLVDGEIISIDGNHARVDIGGAHCNLRHRGQAKGPVRVAVRPDAVQLTGLAAIAGDAHVIETSLKGHITHAAYLGSQMQYSVETPIGELFVIDHRIDTPIIAGEQVAIGFSERGMAVVSGQ